MLETIGAFRDFGQPEEAQDWHGDFSDDQSHADGSKLVITRDIVEEEIGETHEILAPTEQDGEQCGDEQGPFQLAFHSECAQNKEEHDNGTHIHWTARAGLVAPIGTALRDAFPELAVGLVEGGIFLSDISRCTAFCIGNQQTPSFALAVTPLRDVVAIEALGLVVFVAGQNGFATGGFFAKLVVSVKCCRASQYANNCRHRQAYRSLDEMP